MINNKKIIIACVIVIVSIIILIGFIFLINKTDDSYTTITSIDKKFSINMPNKIQYRINTLPANDFKIDLYSEQDDMFMYATSIDKIRQLDLYEVTSDDKTSYFKDKENIRDDTGINKTNINGNKAFEYSLVYFDKNYNKDFYCHVVWIETDENIYVLNFEVSNENADKFKEEFINIKNSFKEL